ncbi:SAM-dependent methyltransferase [Fructobacillus papyrifericola]|uniref:SAM-dependent methyltransferase n=1 Tax=Fructobacillus papyrifericola TaxID=2713172 RepID=A0ABS5QSL9_9LACO|nr:SAM-dependent methyltransferase [Fructobacillus papyrifericola]MBS9336193.1 SAM-dependent methyltransferase [Fructobacillus papyrifericola]
MLNQATLKQVEKQYQDYPQALRKIQAVQACLQALDQQTLPEKPLPKLLYSERQLLREPGLLALDEAFGDLRQTLIEQYGVWFLPNQQLIADLLLFAKGRPIVELMAGNALLTAAFKKAGANAKAVDTLDWLGQDNERPLPWTKVYEQDARAAVLEAIQAVSQGQQEKLPLFIMAWAPNTTEDDWRVLEALRESGQLFDLVVIGEKGPDTNSARFWQSAKLTKPAALNAHYQPFDDFQDAIYLAK